MYPPRPFKTSYQYLVRRNRKHVADTIYGDIIKTLLCILSSSVTATLQSRDQPFQIRAFLNVFIPLLAGNMFVVVSVKVIPHHLRLLLGEVVAFLNVFIPLLAGNM